MSICPTCGNGAKHGIPTAVKILIGLLIAGVVAVPMLIIMMLVAISAIGASASSEFEAVQAELERTRPANVREDGPTNVVFQQEESTSDFANSFRQK